VNATGTALVYCGYIGGASAESGRGIAVDASGSAYVTGETQSTEQTFPVVVGPDLTHNGGNDAFVARVNAAGTTLVYCGYIGGASSEIGYGIAVDAAASAYVAGQTRSTEQTFPVAVGPSVIYNGGTTDAFVAKVNATGTALVYSGYIGGSSSDVVRAVAVDSTGAAYVVGQTSSTEQTFPVAVGPGLTHSGGVDAFVVKVHPHGAALVYCGYIGGASADYGYSIAVDAAGNAYATGQTSSNEQTFPVGVGPDLTYNGGSYDAFVARVSLTLLEGGGAPRPGGQVALSLTASDDAGLSYQIGSSLGTGPIPIDTRLLNLSPDTLLIVSVGGAIPAIFSNYSGILDSSGTGKAAIIIPNDSILVGIRIHSAFVTIKAGAPSNIGSISNTFSFAITT
jgi:beta-propeller repeat-containing protein